jgi:hypothetical protein
MTIGMRADVMAIPVKPPYEFFEFWLLKEAAGKEEGSVAFFLLKCFGNEFTAICKFIAIIPPWLYVKSPKGSKETRATFLVGHVLPPSQQADRSVLPFHPW